MSGMYGAIGAAGAYRPAGATGEGQCVDLAAPQIRSSRVLDEIAPAYRNSAMCGSEWARTLSMCARTVTIRRGRQVDRDRLLLTKCSCSWRVMEQPNWPRLNGTARGSAAHSPRRGQPDRRMGRLARSGGGSRPVFERRRAGKPRLQHRRHFRGSAISRAGQYQNDGFARPAKSPFPTSCRAYPPPAKSAGSARIRCAERQHCLRDSWGSQRGSSEIAH